MSFFLKKKKTFAWVHGVINPLEELPFTNSPNIWNDFPLTDRMEREKKKKKFQFVTLYFKGKWEFNSDHNHINILTLLLFFLISKNRTNFVKVPWVIKEFKNLFWFRSYVNFMKCLKVISFSKFWPFWYRHKNATGVSSKIYIAFKHPWTC